MKHLHGAIVGNHYPSRAVRTSGVQTPCVFHSMPWVANPNCTSGCLNPPRSISAVSYRRFHHETEPFDSLTSFAPSRVYFQMLYLGNSSALQQPLRRVFFSLSYLLAFVGRASSRFPSSTTGFCGSRNLLSGLRRATIMLYISFNGFGTDFKIFFTT